MFVHFLKEGVGIGKQRQLSYLNENAKIIHICDLKLLTWSRPGHKQKHSTTE